MGDGFNAFPQRVSVWVLMRLCWVLQDQLHQRNKLIFLISASHSGPSSWLQREIITSSLLNMHVINYASCYCWLICIVLSCIKSPSLAFRRPPHRCKHNRTHRLVKQAQTGSVLARLYRNIHVGGDTGGGLPPGNTHIMQLRRQKVRAGLHTRLDVRSVPTH